MVEFTERGVTFWRLACRPQNELSLFLFRSLADGGGADNEHVAVATEDVRNPVGGLGSR